jgi:hypothetical protein
MHFSWNPTASIGGGKKNGQVQKRTEARTNDGLKGRTQSEPD